MNGNIHIGKLFGIPFYVHPSWFLVLGLVTWSYGTGIAAQFPGSAMGLPWILGLVTALLLFASVLAHELGHSLVAMRQGIPVRSITLFLFGGLASLEKESKTPAEAFWVAIAGPVVSLILFGLLSLSGAAISGGIGAEILGVIASVNLALALFNLIPGLPLDGGNVLKALVWKVTGNPYRGTVFASRAGQVLSWIAIASGLIPLVLYGSFANIWNLLIGGFLLQNATQSAQSARIQEQLARFTAEDAVVVNRSIVDAELSLRAFADQQILNRNPSQKFLVTDAEEQLVGEISIDSLRSVPAEDWSSRQVRDVMSAIAVEQTVSDQASLLDVVKLLEEKHLSALTVIRENGSLVGRLEKPSILAFLQRQAQPSAA
ncbi:site-2 protease family protein [Cyanobacteria bacterium FACHB-63]|nr:site-2 protease family protein [Cyanobacteria bacterium FACHB-63]